MTHHTRNMLKDATKPFNVVSETEIAERMKGERAHFDSISEYTKGNAPTAKDIRTVEKVLKYAAQCKYAGFTDTDASLVMSCTTNILRWSLGYTDNEAL